MRTYLLIGGIMAVIACIICLGLIYCANKTGESYSRHGYNLLISGVFLFWFLWPIQVIWIIYLLFLRITNTNKLKNLERDIHEELTSEEES